MKTKVPSLDRLIDTYLLCCTTEGKSPKTLDFYKANLRRFSRFLLSHGLDLPVPDIGPAEARSFIFHLQNNVTRWEDSPFVNDSKRLSPFSVQGYARTIKAFWSWLLAEGYIEGNSMARLKLPKVPRKIVPTFTPEHMRRLMAVLDLRSPTGFRNYAMVLILLDTGIRLSELVNLDLEGLDLEQSCFLVRGKGSKERMVPYGNRVRRALWRYLTVFRPEPACPQTGRLFLSESGLPLRPRLVQSMMSRLGQKAGVSGVRCSPHTMRHTFAKQYLMHGGDVFSLQRILGHSSLEVVRLYVNLAPGDVSAQHRKFSPADNMELPGRVRRARGGFAPVTRPAVFEARPRLHRGGINR